MSTWEGPRRILASGSCSDFRMLSQASANSPFRSADADPGAARGGCSPSRRRRQRRRGRRRSRHLVETWVTSGTFDDAGARGEASSSRLGAPRSRSCRSARLDQPRVAPPRPRWCHDDDEDPERLSGPERAGPLAPITGDLSVSAHVGEPSLNRPPWSVRDRPFHHDRGGAWVRPEPCVVGFYVDGRLSISSHRT